MVFSGRKNMISKSFFSALTSVVFATTLLLNCTAKSESNTVPLPTKDSSQAVSAQPKSMEEAIATIEAAIEKSDLEKKVLTGLQKKISSKPANSFDELELQAFVNLILNTYGPDLSRDGRAALRGVLSYLVTRLSKYQISGAGFAWDANAAFIMNTQNPSFTGIFKDTEGNTKSRVFDCLIRSIGLKAALSINFSFIFITGDINFENSNKVLELGTGIDLTVNPFRLFLPDPNAERNRMAAQIWLQMMEQHGPADFMEIAQMAEAASQDPRLPAEQSNKLRTSLVQLILLYVPFTNAPGGMVMVGTGLGVNVGLGLSGSLSMVTGGTLTPRIN
jgi:hypothetical protein